MIDGPDSTAAVRVPEPDGFGNRKLIRPSLNRTQARVAEAAGERRERVLRTSERALDSALRAPEHAAQHVAQHTPLHAAQHAAQQVTQHAAQHVAQRAPGTPAKKTPPVEQTHAENFYYQKQIQSKTPMVVVTRDGEELRGVIEWYDKSCFKLNRGSGQANALVYKASVRYMFKEGEETK
jgi:sRNA-binding regulator protein Hfq